MLDKPEVLAGVTQQHPFVDKIEYGINIYRQVQIYTLNK